ncbi:MAG: hypothetical protein ACRDHF_08325 [Tepidiformaceae bacterium]
MKLNVTRKALLGAGLLAVIAVGLFGACGSDDGGSQEAEVISAINILDNAGLHGIDESINEEQEIPANARTVALRLVTVVELTSWPGDLADGAATLAESLTEFAAALDVENPDMAQAGSLATEVHQVEHDFSGEVWAWLQEEAGIDLEDEGEHDQ